MGYNIIYEHKFMLTFQENMLPSLSGSLHLTQVDAEVIGRRKYVGCLARVVANHSYGEGKTSWNLDRADIYPLFSFLNSIEWCGVSPPHGILLNVMVEQLAM